VAYLPKLECLVTRWITGRPATAEELRVPPLLEAVARGLRAVHAGPPLPATFSAFRLGEAYRDETLARGGEVPPAFAEAKALADRIEAALRDPEHDPVPCHDDLLSANFILLPGGGVRLVDWEYAGMGDRYFDLGNLSVNNAFNEAGDEWLLECYWGEPCTRGRFATLRLMRIMSDLREAMWGVVQGAISELDFDFAGYAEEHFERVRAGFADPRLGVWLEDARRGA
jgi:thiamine kinase-like enzyme